MSVAVADPVDQAIFQRVREAAAGRGASFIPVRLLCEEAELVRRINFVGDSRMDSDRA
jgi:hypothetical protein